MLTVPRSNFTIAYDHQKPPSGLDSALFINHTKYVLEPRNPARSSNSSACQYIWLVTASSWDDISYTTIFENVYGCRAHDKTQIGWYSIHQHIAINTAHIHHSASNGLCCLHRLLISAIVISLIYQFAISKQSQTIKKIWYQKHQKQCRSIKMG
jgi:hypothetical protein